MDLLPSHKTFLILGSLLGFLAVAFGAFGAHALKQKISIDHQAIFEVGARYHMYHALLLIVIGLIYASFPSGFIQAAGWLIFSGTLIFSGSLYLLALTAISAWGAVTPIGGLLLLAGWLSLFIGFLRG